MPSPQSTKQSIATLEARSSVTWFEPSAVAVKSKLSLFKSLISNVIPYAVPINCTSLLLLRSFVRLVVE